IAHEGEAAPRGVDPRQQEARGVAVRQGEGVAGAEPLAAVAPDALEPAGGLEEVGEARDEGGAVARVRVQGPLPGVLADDVGGAREHEAGRLSFGPGGEEAAGVIETPPAAPPSATPAAAATACASSTRTRRAAPRTAPPGAA